MFVLVHGPGEHATTQIKLNLTNQRGNVLSYFSLINECIDTSEQRRHGVIHEIHLHLVFMYYVATLPRRGGGGGGRGGDTVPPARQSAADRDRERSLRLHAYDHTR